MERNTLFIVSSAINITTNPLSYTSVRSTFSAEERAKQTLNTIQSIRTAMPESKILLIETGKARNLPYNIEFAVDKYLYLGNERIVRDAVDGPYKGLGEICGLYLADQWIRHFNADYYFKLSGRYYLNENFPINDWTGNGYTGRFGGGNMLTVLYGFPNRLYNNWRHALVQSQPGLLRGEAIESALPRYFEQSIFNLTELGVSGCVSHHGGFVSL
ncbi:hypothetical protein [Peribacillus butanolivorans]